jgi:hypothetical protein
MRLRQGPAFGVLVLLLQCGGPGPPPEPADVATRRQRDSAIARMPVPGANAVDRALGVLEQADRRNAAIDSAR